MKSVWPTDTHWQLSANLMKVWWRLESFLERWKRSVSCGYDDPTEPQYHGGYGNTFQAPPRMGLWIAGAILVSTVLICGALWLLSSRVASLEVKVERLTDELNLGKTK